MTSAMKLVGPLVAWTLFVWVSRIRNIWGDDDLSTGGQWLRTGFAVIFLAFGTAMAVRLVRTRESGLQRSDRILLQAFILWTVGFWLVRGIGIIVDDHEVGFTVIHTILMVISLGLAAQAGRVLRSSSISSFGAVAR